MQPTTPQTKRTRLLSILGAVLCLAVVPAAFGAPTIQNNSILYTPTVDLSSGPQNTSVGSYGGVFLTNYTYWPGVNWLGYYDKDGDGLANSHEVSLWKIGGTGGSSPTPIATATVPAGTSAPLVNGYRWVQLPATVDMWYGAWYILAAQTDGVDTWGDLISGTQINWSSQYVTTTDGHGGERAGRDASTWSTAAPGTQVSTSDSIFPAANMAYNLAVPEPTTVGLLALGLCLGLWRRRKN